LRRHSAGGRRFWSYDIRRLTRGALAPEKNRIVQRGMTPFALSARLNERCTFRNRLQLSFHGAGRHFNLRDSFTQPLFAAA
jgi:hypothetical protein